MISKADKHLARIVLKASIRIRPWKEGLPQSTIRKARRQMYKCILTDVTALSNPEYQQDALWNTKLETLDKWFPKRAER